MRVSVRVDGGSGRHGDQEQDLAVFLSRQDQLRGRVQLIAEQRQPGGMSQSIASVIVELGPAGVTAFASALIAWIRHRTADTRVTVCRPDGTKFEISANRVRGLGAAEINALVAQISGTTSGDPSGHPS